MTYKIRKKPKYLKVKGYAFLIYEEARLKKERERSQRPEVKTRHKAYQKKYYQRYGR